MAYSYYSQQPNWGTTRYEYESAGPPRPTYQPQSSWRGGDYYRAHGGGMESSLFDNIWSKMKNFAGFGGGVNRAEAKHWHRRVYSGLVSVNQLMPAELGAAAGYEAIRLWESHKNLYREPLSHDRGREREALAGIAVAEASKLWQIASNGRHGGRETSEVAAATAERIFNHQYDNDSYNRYDAHEGSSRYEQYEYEPRHEGSHHRRRRSSSSYYRPSNAGQYIPASAAMAIPHAANHHHQGHGHYEDDYEYDHSPGMGSHSYGGHGGYPMSAPTYSQPVIPPYAQPSPYLGGSQYVPSAAGSMVLSSSSGHHRSRRNSFGGSGYSHGGY